MEFRQKRREAKGETCPVQLDTALICASRVGTYNHILKGIVEIETFHSIVPSLRKENQMHVSCGLSFRHWLRPQLPVMFQVASAAKVKTWAG